MFSDFSKSTIPLSVVETTSLLITLIANLAFESFKKYFKILLGYVLFRP